MQDADGHIPEEPRKRLYGALMVMNFLMRSFYPATEWPFRLGKLISDADLPDEVGHRSAGFPVNWRDDPLWFPTAD